MRIFKLVLIIILIMPVNVLAWKGVVVNVADGDTIWVETEDRATKIRLYGIDAPEIKQPYGPEASAFLSNIVLNATVSVIDIDIDRYGRNVSIVVTNEGFALQELLLYAGYAWVWPTYCKNCSQWSDLQKNAQENKRGLWASEDEQMAPWQWRKK